MFASLRILVPSLLIPISLLGISPEKASVLDWLQQEEMSRKFGDISDAIWSYAELGFQEYKSSALLTKTLEEAGFKVERGVAGIPTAFVATYGSGKPVIGLLGEYDALPMISQKGRVPVRDPLIDGAPGHGCGHNTMGTAATSAAIAIAETIKRFNLSGMIKVFGSPAEEILASRPYMIRAGVFEGVDVVIDNHASSGFSTRYGVAGSALYSIVFTFKGKTAHSASQAWNGRSALDAVEIMNVSTNYLREHLHFTHRMHYVILDGGEAPNVVPDQASVWYFLRNSDERLREMYERVINCANGAALATGTELAEVRCLTGIHQQFQNKPLAELIYKNMELVGFPEWTEEEHAFARELQRELGREEIGLSTELKELTPPPTQFTGGASTDVGDVTLIAPTATLRFPTGVPGAYGHHWSTVSSNYGSAARKGMMAGAKVIAATAVDLLTQPQTLKNIRSTFEERAQKHPYETFLPEDAVPPLDINKALMEKWRPAMQECYLE